MRSIETLDIQLGQTCQELSDIEAWLFRMAHIKHGTNPRPIDIDERREDYRKYLMRLIEHGA